MIMCWRRALVAAALLPALARADLPELPPLPPRSGHNLQMVAATTASVAIVTMVLALVGVGVYEKYDTATSADLRRAADQNQALLGNPDVSSWFMTPTCSPPMQLTGDAIMQFKSDCNTRSDWANASVGLAVITGSLLLTATVTEAIGYALEARAFRYLKLVPSVTAKGAGAALRVTF
jgi:hypothetical protein